MITNPSLMAMPQSRAYVFVNAALSSMQKGIQAAHVMIDMCKRYREWNGDPAIAERFWTWAARDRTMIVCHGGFNAGMMDWWKFVMHSHHSYPREYFREDYETLGGMTTAVGIVIPFQVYNVAALIKKAPSQPDFNQSLIDSYLAAFEPFDRELIHRLNSSHLAT